MKRFNVLSAALMVSALVAPMTAQAALVGHWTLDETSGSTAFDSAPPAQNGAIGAGVTVNQPGVPGFGTSFAFNGSTGQGVGVVNVGNAPWATMANNLTIGGWINPTALGGTRRLWGIDGPGAPTNAGWGFGLNGTGLRFTTFGVLDYSIAVPGGVPLNQFTHIAAVFDATNDVTFYVNGLSIGTILGTNPANNAGADTFTIGGGAFFGTERFVGRIDNVQVFDTALNAAQVFAMTQPIILIPEPATATLGLLSLGGLMMRRRRMA